MSSVAQIYPHTVMFLCAVMPVSVPVVVQVSYTEPVCDIPNCGRSASETRPCRLAPLIEGVHNRSGSERDGGRPNPRPKPIEIPIMCLSTKPRSSRWFHRWVDKQGSARGSAIRVGDAAATHCEITGGQDIVRRPTEGRDGNLRSLGRQPTSQTARYCEGPGK